MTIPTDKTWETKPVVVYGDVGSDATEASHLLWGMKNALLDMTIPAIVRLSATASASSSDPQKTVEGASQADPCEITISGHGFATGERVRLSGIGGMVELDDTDYTITVTGTDTFTLDDVDSTLFTTYTTGGVCRYQDNIDRWASQSDVWYGSGSHAWIVLEFPNVSPNGKYQILIDWGNGYFYKGNLYVSESGSFFGGTSSVRPTASDEATLMSGPSWTYSSECTTRTAYICQSTDGQVVRMHSGYNRSQYSLWAFERVKNPVSGWTKPCIGYTFNGSNSPTASQFFSNTYIHSMNNMADPSENGMFRASTLTFDTTQPVRDDLGGQGQDFDASYYVQPMGLVREVASSADRMGEMFDLWEMTTYGTQWNYLEGHTAWEMVKVGDGFVQPAEAGVPWWRA